MVDYNQALDVADALERGRALDERRHLLAGGADPPRRLCRLCDGSRARCKTPIQIGENFSLPSAMEAALAAGAADYVMPDLERIGGVTGWRRAAALAAERRIAMSSHLFPEVSAHLLAATPTCHFLEYVDWADRIVREPLRIVDGYARRPRPAGQRPGLGSGRGRAVSDMTDRRAAARD